MNKGYFHVIAGSLTLFICVTVQASTSYTYTPLDATSLGATATYPIGIDGSNIVGYYADGSHIITASKPRSFPYLKLRGWP